MNTSEFDLTQILKDVSKKHRYQGEDLVPGMKFGVKYPSARRHVKENENDDTTVRGEYLPLRPLNEENLPEFRKEDISSPSAAGQDESAGRTQRSRIPYKKLSNRLEIPGLMHPDDWMGKKPKKRKKKSTDVYADEKKACCSRNVVDMIKRKHLLMYGENIPPTQLLEGYPQDPSTFTKASSSHTFPTEVTNVLDHEQNLHLPLASSNVANTSLMGNFQYQLQPNYEVTSQPLLSNRPMLCLPQTYIGFSGPSMYPTYQPCTSSLMTPLNTTNYQNPNKRHKEQDIFTNVVNFFTEETPSENRSIEMPTSNENFSFKPALTAGSTYLGLADLDSEDMNKSLENLLDSDANFGGSSNFINHLGNNGQPYNEIPTFNINPTDCKQAAWPISWQVMDMRENLAPTESLNHTGVASDNQYFPGELRESNSERCNISLNNKQQFQTNEASGNSSPVLTSIRASRNKMTNTRRDLNHSQSRNCKENNPIFDPEVCAPPYLSTCSKFHSNTTREERIGFRCDCDTISSDYRWRACTPNIPQKNHGSESTRPQARCISPDLFASQDFLNTSQNNAVYSNTSERHDETHFTTAQSQFGFSENTPDDETFERNFSQPNTAFEADATHSREPNFQRSSSNSHLHNTHASRCDAELGRSDTNPSKVNESASHCNERTQDDGENTPNDSDILLSPKMSFKHTEDSYRSRKGGLVHVSTVEGEMVINPQQWRLAHKFTGLLGRKAAEVSRDLFKNPGKGELGRPRKVTATEELVHLYTTST